LAVAGSKAGTAVDAVGWRSSSTRLGKVEPQLRRRRLVHVHVGVERAERDGHGRVRAAFLAGSKEAATSKWRAGEARARSVRKTPVRTMDR
jgi:hypothetical protein